MLRLFGGLFLLYLAYTLSRKPVLKAVCLPLGGEEYWLSLRVFLLTLSNPLTIFSFLAIFGSVNVQGETLQLLLIVLGVFIGSMCWWMILGAIVVLVRHRLSLKLLEYIRYFSIAFLCFLGLNALRAFF